jgi:hypothetical protein
LSASHARPNSARLNRGVIALLVAAVPAAAWLDGWCAPLATIAPAVAWLDLAALACLAWAALQPGALRDGEHWSTPFDGLLLSVVALATIGALQEHGTGPATVLLRQSLACGGAFVGLAFLLRRTPGGAEFAWRALAWTTAGMGAHALWAATGGLDALARQSHLVDLRWSGSHGLTRMLAFATVATAGRAAEPQAPAGWRLAFLVGAAGVAVHAVSGGFAIDPLSLARLDAPMEFSAACVTWLLAAALARGAWDLRKERRAEAWRWRMLAGATAGLGLASVLGDGSGGEGVRALAVLAAVTMLGSPEVPAEAAEPGVEDETAPLARAA